MRHKDSTDRKEAIHHKVLMDHQGLGMGHKEAIIGRRDSISMIGGAEELQMASWVHVSES